MTEGSTGDGSPSVINLTVLYDDGRCRQVKGTVGWTLMEALRDGGIDELEAICGGCLSCSTCHVIIDDAWFDKLAPVTPDEEDMLDLAQGTQRCSRLSCQVTLTEDMEGLAVRIPC